MTSDNQVTVFHQKCFIWRANEGANVSQLAKVVLDGYAPDSMQKRSILKLFDPLKNNECKRKSQNFLYNSSVVVV